MPNGIVDPSSSRFNSLIDRLGGSSCKWVVSVLLFLIINKPKNKHDISIDYAPRRGPLLTRFQIVWSTLMQFIDPLSSRFNSLIDRLHGSS